MTDFRRRLDAVIAELKARGDVEIAHQQIGAPARPDEIARARKKAPGGALHPDLVALAAVMNGCDVVWNYKGEKVKPGSRKPDMFEEPLGGRIRLNGLDLYGTGYASDHPVFTRTKYLAVGNREHACLHFDAPDSCRVCYQEPQPGEPYDALWPTGLSLERFLDLILTTRGVHDWLRLFCSGKEGDARGDKARELIAALFPDVDLDALGPRSGEARIYPPPGYRSAKEWAVLLDQADAAGDHRKAIEICDGAIKDHPSSKATLSFMHNRGLHQSKLGLAAEAEASYRAALARDPAFAYSQQNLSNLLLEQNRNEEVEALLLGWVHQSPGRGNLPWDLGVVAARRGNKEQALEALAQGLRLKPEWAEEAAKEYVELRDDPDFKALLAAGERLPNPFPWYLPSRYTTRPAPIDVGARYPELTPKPAIRLHPRARGALPVDASKLGGVFLANGEGWPTCKQHAAPYTAVLQLRAADVPDAGYFPAGTDLFQLLWCARDHKKNDHAPAIAARWLSAKDLPAPEAANPADPTAVDHYVPTECALFPERVVDYPDRWELGDLEDRLQEDEELRRLAAKIDPTAAEAEGGVAYQSLLSAANGVKLGGYPDWIQDPDYPRCPSCNEPMEHYLTVASTEWDGISFHRWKPIEEGLPDRPGGGHIDDHGLTIGDAGNLYVFVCRKHARWPVAQASQCS